MKRRWLRGVLLGVSLALLLAGGVALAQPPVTVDPSCRGCCPNAIDPYTCDFWTITSTGWDAGEKMIAWFTSPGPFGSIAAWPLAADGNGTLEFYVANWCDPLSPEEASVQGGAPYHFIPPEPPGWQAGDYGQWTVEVKSDGGPSQGTATGHVLFAQDCSALEFVPEPGTIALLGSGLLGVAGYAGLRWRGRQ